MSMSDDIDPFAPTSKALTHEIGQNLDSLSLHELDERIILLQHEIERLSQARHAKHASHHAAHAIFSSPHS
jgi:uncharacterized small protein (DUF1192 family)